MSPSKRHGSHWAAAPVTRDDFRDPLRPVPVSVTGAHRSAGATTIARLLGAADLGLHVPRPADGHPPRFLVTARTHAHGLLAARNLLTGHQAHDPGAYLIGLVLVPDGPGPRPVRLSCQIAELASRTPVYRTPWLPDMQPGGPLSEDSGALKQSLLRWAEQAALTSTPSLKNSEDNTSCSIFTCSRSDSDSGCTTPASARHHRTSRPRSTP